MSKYNLRVATAINVTAGPQEDQKLFNLHHGEPRTTQVIYEQLAFSTCEINRASILSKLTCPTSLGLQVSVMSYCLMSPCTQLLKYRYLSSREIKMSDISPLEVINEGE